MKNGCRGSVLRSNWNRVSPFQEHPERQRTASPWNTVLSLLAFLLFSVGSLDTVLADDVVVYRGTVGRHTRVQMGSVVAPGPVEITREGAKYPKWPQRQQRSITNRLDLVVSLIPRQSVVEAPSISLVSETEKKAAKSSVERCLKTDAVKKSLSTLTHQLIGRTGISGESVRQFYTALDQCLESSRLERFKYSPELQHEQFAGPWVPAH